MGLETLVRPLVVPSSVPVLRAPLNPADEEPTTLDGGVAQLITLSHSYSFSSSSSYRKWEAKERWQEQFFDEVRVFRKDPNGTVHLDQYVECEVTYLIVTVESTRTWNEQKITTSEQEFPRARQSDNTNILSRGNKRTHPDGKKIPQVARTGGTI